MLGVFFLEERNFLSDLYNQKLVWLGPNPSSCCDPGRSSFIRENGHSGCLFAHHQAQSIFCFGMLFFRVHIGLIILIEKKTGKKLTSHHSHLHISNYISMQYV